MLIPALCKAFMLQRLPKLDSVPASSKICQGWEHFLQIGAFFSF